MTVWRLIPHHNDREDAIAWTKRTGAVAIGWGRVGHLKEFSSQESLKRLIPVKYPVPEFPNNAHFGAPSLWNFYHGVQEEDLIVISGDKGRSIVVQVAGPYRFNKEDAPKSSSDLDGDYFHQRRVDLTSYDPDRVWHAAGGTAKGQAVYQTLVKCARPVDLGEI